MRGSKQDNDFLVRRVSVSVATRWDRSIHHVRVTSEKIERGAKINHHMTECDSQEKRKEIDKYIHLYRTIHPRTLSKCQNTMYNSPCPPTALPLQISVPGIPSSPPQSRRSCVEGSYDPIPPTPHTSKPTQTNSTVPPFPAFAPFSPPVQSASLPNVGQGAEEPS